MDSPRKLANKWFRGFSLLEVVVVISIFGLLAAVSTSVYGSFKAHENLEIATTGVVEALRQAQASAQAGKGDSGWGVKILPAAITIFEGASYASRVVQADQTLSFSGGSVATGLSEVVFSKLSGSTLNAGTITLTNSSGAKNILVNEKGTITY